MPDLIPKHGGYRKLKSFQVAQLVYDITVRFAAQKEEHLMTENEKSKEIRNIRSSAAEYLTFIASGGSSEASVEMRYEDENIWLTQKMMATLYDVDVRIVNYHLKNIFSDSELEEESVIRNFRITAADGKNYNTKHDNLQAIIAVGFKIENERVVQFRKWAN